MAVKRLCGQNPLPTAASLGYGEAMFAPRGQGGMAVGLF
jgi:hypothetical protein